MAYGSSQARGSNHQSHSCQPTPQPQQCQIWAVSVNYAAVHGSARSLTHWAGPRITTASSWLLVGFITTEPQQELPTIFFFLAAPTTYGNSRDWIQAKSQVTYAAVEFLTHCTTVGTPQVHLLKWNDWDPLLLHISTNFTNIYEYSVNIRHHEVTLGVALSNYIKK